MSIVVGVRVCVRAGGFIDSCMHFHFFRACTVSSPKGESAIKRCVERECVYMTELHSLAATV
jgi:hypothetical protein